MKEIPIIFSTEMVKAILDNRKFMTRRVIKPQPLFVADPNIPFKTPDADPKGIIKCPYGQPGDRLWVRETTWISECKRYLSQGLEKGNSELDAIDLKTGKRYVHQCVGEGDYAVTDGMITSWSRRGRYLRSGREIEGFDIGFADVDTAVKAILFSGNIVLKNYSAQFRKKLPSIYMPKIAARIWLEVVNVRVERLQDITVEDVISEGLEADNDIRNPDPSTHESIKSWNLAWAQHVFRELWDKLNAKRGYGWEINPWVWVVEFRRVQP